MNTTPVRAVRVPEELWARAEAKAKGEGRQMSTVIRRLLSDYVKQR